MRLIAIRTACVISLAAGLAIAGHAQSTVTRVVRVEVDGKATDANYKVVFDAGNYWIEAKRTDSGFIVPDAVLKSEWLNFVFIFGDHKLRFDKVHVSKFSTDWTVGVDEAPFSEELVKRAESKRTVEVYFIRFSGEPGTQRTVTISRPRS